MRGLRLSRLIQSTANLPSTAGLLLMVSSLMVGASTILCPALTTLSLRVKIGPALQKRFLLAWPEFRNQKLHERDTSVPEQYPLGGKYFTLTLQAIGWLVELRITRSKVSSTTTYYQLDHKGGVSKVQAKPSHRGRSSIKRKWEHKNWRDSETLVTRVIWYGGPSWTTFRKLRRDASFCWAIIIKVLDSDIQATLWTRHFPPDIWS